MSNLPTNGKPTFFIQGEDLKIWDHVFYSNYIHKVLGSIDDFSLTTSVI